MNLMAKDWPLITSQESKLFSQPRQLASILSLSLALALFLSWLADMDTKFKAEKTMIDARPISSRILDIEKRALGLVHLSQVHRSVRECSAYIITSTTR
jgi:hypothetical protein